ncbi:MAG: carotenoid biosynthesis protein [Chloroflexota bacterium]
MRRHQLLESMKTILLEDKTVLAMMLFWIIILVVTPGFHYFGGEQGLAAAVNLGVLSQTMLVCGILIRKRGWCLLLRFAPLTLFCVFMAELIGSKTGNLFGNYYYTNVLQPQILGVPVLIPLAWMMMLPPSRAISQRIVHANKKPVKEDIRAVLSATLAALSFTAWDLFLDPLMVKWNLWVWDPPGAYFGIPVVNFFGWFAVSWLVNIVVFPAIRLPDQLIIVYAFTWIMQTLGLALFWGLYGPALGGFFGMGVFVFLAMRPIIHESKAVRL